jgi:hypothetical protein
VQRPFFQPIFLWDIKKFGWKNGLSFAISDPKNKSFQDKKYIL